MSARGCFDKRDRLRERPQIVLRFDRETFAQVNAYAHAQEVSFSAAARELIEFGLEAAKAAETAP